MEAARTRAAVSRRWTLPSGLLLLLALLDSAFGAGLSNFTAAATTVSWYRIKPCFVVILAACYSSFAPA
jgi:hypothetical protein